MVLDAFDQLAQCRHFSFHVTRFVLTISYCQFHSLLHRDSVRANPDAERVLMCDLIIKDARQAR